MDDVVICTVVNERKVCTALWTVDEVCSERRGMRSDVQLIITDERTDR